MDTSQIPSSRARIDETASAAVQIDPAASAALAEAVRSAHQGLKPAPATELPGKTGARPRLSTGRFLGQAAIALLLIGAGWGAATMETLSTRDALRRMEAEAARSRDILAKLTDNLASLKSTMAAARDVEHTASTTTATDRTKLAQKVDTLAASLQEPSKKLAALEDRLDRMESQIMAGLNSLNAAKPTAAAAAPAPPQPQATSAPDVRPAKAEPVEGWVLREVYNGSALVESRGHGLYEVGPGSTIPGVGRVETIERRGARWVVVTDKGIIGTYR